VVDPVIPDQDIIEWEPGSSSVGLDGAAEVMAALNAVSYRSLGTVGDPGCTDLADLDNASGVLRVWYLLVEGLMTAVEFHTDQSRPHVLDTLFLQLHDLLTCPGKMNKVFRYSTKGGEVQVLLICFAGPMFALHCVNHMLLPMLQGWLRRLGSQHALWETNAPNFKQCCGLTTDLVVEFIIHLKGK